MIRYKNLHPDTTYNNYAVSYINMYNDLFNMSMKIKNFKDSYQKMVEILLLGT